MSSTRKAADGAPLRQERFCSAPQYDEGLKALPVAKRAELVSDPALRGLIWFLQFRSLPPREKGIGRIGGIGRIAEEMLAGVADAIERRGGYRVESVDGVSTQRPRLDQASWCDCAVTAIKTALTDFCLNPGCEEFPALWIHSSAVAREPALQSDEFLKVTAAYRNRVVAGASAVVAQTEVAAHVQRMLSFSMETSRASLVEGAPRTGKSTAAKAFCEGNAGLARFVVTPPGVAEQDLLRAVADAIGVADSTAYKNVQIRQAIEEVLRRSRLMLVFDEAQWLLPQHMRVQSIPQRILWVKQLIDWSVPVAFVALPDFTRLLKNVGEKTGWPIEQVSGRIVYDRLPDVLSELDLRAIVAKHVPGAGANVKDLIVGCAMQDKDQAGAVAKIVDFARFLSRDRGAGEPTFEDFKKAALNHQLPSSCSLAAALAGRASKPARATAASAPRARRELAAMAPLQAGEGPRLGGRLGAAGVTLSSAG